MPTITLSWADLALLGLTAGLIASIVVIGRSNSVTSKFNSDEKNNANSKKKKNRNKKGTITTFNQSNITTLPPPTKPTQTISETNSNQSQSPQVTSVVEKIIDPNFQLDFPPLSTSNNDQNNKHETNRQQRPFAEKHKKPVRKTIVDDMIDEDVEKPLKIARVMNIVNPQPQPPEPQLQVPFSPLFDSEEGWEKVPDTKRSRNTDHSVAIRPTKSNQITSTTSQTSEQKPSKRQRQNAKKKEATKALKAAEEAERLRQLALHKREQERAKINSSVNTSKKSTSKAISGGMKSTMGEDGRLIWE